MKVLYVASEANPWMASGGLGDVAGSLPIALRKRLIGCRVVDLDTEQEYGIVTDVLNHGASDILELADNGIKKYVPVIPDIVKEIDTDNEIIRIKYMQGLFM